jgi:hypothetical protein
LPDEPAANEDIVLAAVVRSEVQLRHTRPEVSNLTAQAEAVEKPHI